MMTGRQRVRLMCALASLPVVILLPLAAQSYGLSGVAMVFASNVACQSLGQCVVVWRLTGVRTDPDLSWRQFLCLSRSLLNFLRASYDPIIAKWV